MLVPPGLTRWPMPNRRDQGVEIEWADAPHGLPDRARQWWGKASVSASAAKQSGSHKRHCRTWS